MYAVYDTLPKGLKKLGQANININASNILDCSLHAMIEVAKGEARKLGANVVKITQQKVFSVMGNPCHRLKISLHKGDSIADLERHNVEKPLGDVDYALLHIYRYNGEAPFVSYNLKLGDSILCRVKNNYKTTIKIKKEGLNSLVAINKYKSELPFDVEFGKEYFLRCSVNTGNSTGRPGTVNIILAAAPNIEFVSYRIGKMEFKSFKAKRDETKLNN